MTDTYNILWNKFIEEKKTGSMVAFSEWLVDREVQATSLLRELHKVWKRGDIFCPKCGFDDHHGPDCELAPFLEGEG